MAETKSAKSFIQKKWPFLLVILYVLSPIDLIPDFIAPLGSVDDTALLILEFMRQYNEYRKNAVQKD